MVRYAAQMEDAYIVVRAYLDDTLIGSLEVEKGRSAYVQWVKVGEQYRRRGVATGMYEVAAATAFAEWNLPLASSVDRSPMSDGFWRKQAGAGRAVLDGYRYYLEFPPPSVGLGGTQ